MSYRLKYDFTIEQGEFTKEQIGKSGGTDALVIGSVIYGDDGSSSTAWFSKDGRTGYPLSELELFKAWNALGARLQDSAELSEPLRAIARDSINAMRRHLGVPER